ncbi:MAG: outer membrane protein transport protein [Bacteroidota bacterium]
MKKYLLTTAALSLFAGAAAAGGIDRSGQGIGVIFEDTGATGSYAQISLGSVDPEANRAGGGQTDPLSQYNQGTIAVKKQLSDDLSLSFIIDQPFGVDVAYVDDPAGTPPFLTFAGGLATIDSTAYTAILRYELDENFSVHGGIRGQEVSGNIVSAGVLSASSGLDYGYLIGAAYERPDIALRVALTYNSAITSEFTGLETDLGTFVTSATAFEVEFPASINLDFQSGIAADTLLFGSIRYVEWDGFNLTTPGVGEYVRLNGDTTTYSLGVGRRINEQLSLAASLGYEAEGEETTSPLAPTTGTTSITLSASYSVDEATTLSGGVTFAKLGDQTLAGTGGLVTWDDNSAVGFGFRLGHKF